MKWGAAPLIGDGMAMAFASLSVKFQIITGKFVVGVNEDYCVAVCHFQSCRRVIIFVITGLFSFAVTATHG